MNKMSGKITVHTITETLTSLEAADRGLVVKRCMACGGSGFGNRGSICHECGGKKVVVRQGE